MFLNTLTHTNCTSDPRPRKISVTGHSFTKNELFLQLTAIPPPRSATRSISDIDSGFSEIDPENASFDDAKLTSHTPTAILNPIAISTFNLLPDAILVLSASAQILHANTTAVELFSCSLVGLSIDILFPTFPAPCSRNKKHVLCACTPTNPSRTITVECTFGTSSREALLMNYCGKDNGKDLSIMTMRKGDEPRDGERKSEVAGKECGAGVGKRDRYRESRYYTEFEELELLGRGGFGTVYKARNLLDEQIYAIKKVRLNCPPDELIPGPNSSSSSFGSLSSSSILSSTYPNTVQSRILREVKTFARVSNHPNICRYYNAWVEVDYDSLEQAEQVHLTHDDDDEEDVDTFLHPNMDLFNADFDLSTTGITGDEVAFEYSNSRSGTGSDETWEEVERSGWDEDDDGDTEAEQDTTTTTLAPSRAVEKKGLRSVLYIQMQWCPYSDLRKWLAKRTDVEPVESLMIFKQIVQAIVHVHSQGFTHQDIKPENVYIDDRGKVYLGDFGLSSSVAGDLEGQCTCGCHEDGKNYDSDSDSDSESDHENDEHGSIFFMDPTRADDDHDHEDMIEGDHAKPVSIRSRRSRSRNHSPSLSLRACCHCRASKTAGAPATMTYSAPELLIASLRSGSQANRSTDLQAADIYSLGIVFLELFCVFGTRMERAVVSLVEF
ncbi:kinase-like domain-containing protein [Jimgerdemannia flammicorona]|uniref:Kinase-like domain-containing protein n=1 Tax=Jimgerdemannia flammicorona TaxID=994334 RepID=A0A433Q1Z1_9FUNG|nr:kinase-like domain-containing protein [Jimgerdemannia flammicorona]